MYLGEYPSLETNAELALTMVRVCQVRRKWELLSVISLFYYQYVSWPTTCGLGFLDSQK